MSNFINQCMTALRVGNRLPLSFLVQYEVTSKESLANSLKEATKKLSRKQLLPWMYVIVASGYTIVADYRRDARSIEMEFEELEACPASVWSGARRAMLADINYYELASLLLTQGA